MITLNEWFSRFFSAMAYGMIIAHRDQFNP